MEARFRSRITSMPSDTERQTSDELRELLGGVRRRLRTLTTAVLLLTLAVVLCAGAVYGEVANYFGGDAMLQVAIAIGAAALGFFFGWLAGRRA